MASPFDYLNPAPLKKPGAADPLDALHALLTDPMHANDAVTLAGLRHTQTGEFEDLAAANPGDQRFSAGAAQSAKDEAADPYTGDAATTLSNFFSPDQERQRAEELAAKVAPDIIKGQSAENVARIANEGKIVPAQIKATGTMGDPATIEGLARSAVQDFHGTMASMPAALKPQVLQRMYQLDPNPQSPTNQAKQMSEASNDVLDVLDRNDFLGQADHLHELGLFTPGVGTLRKLAAEHGMGTLFGMGDDVAGKLGQFETTRGLLISALQRAHAGARGAGNSEMAARFEKLLADQGDIPTFKGELNGIRGLLEQYASHTNPTRGFTNPGDTFNTPPTAAELAGGQ